MPALLTLLKRATAAASALIVAGSVAGATGTTAGTCTATTPWTETFDTNTTRTVIRNHAYTTSVNTVTATAGKYTFWNSIDHTGNGGHALYLNVTTASAAPILLYEQTVNVPAGSDLSYRHYARTHQTSPSRLRYTLTETASGATLATRDGNTLTTGYTQETLPTVRSNVTQVTLRIYSLNRGVSGDANVLKLDDLKLSCPVPAKPSLTITKTGNGPWTAGQSGATYTLSVKNVGTSATSGAVTVRDLLPSGITAPASFTSGSWSCTTSGQTVTCTGTPNLGVGSSSSFTLPVQVQSSAPSSVTNRASVGGGGDPDPIPDPASCTTTGGQCAVYTTTVTVPVTPPAPVTGVCSAATPFVQSFNVGGASGEVRNHDYRSDAGVVQATDGTYTFWKDIDRTGNGGFALFMNIRNFEGRNGGTLTTPGLLYEQRINVPAGAEVSYSNWVRSHSSTATQLRYVFRDAGGAVLRQFDGAVATTSYTQQTVPTFTSPGPQVTLQILTLKDGTSVDANVLKLDDLKLSCPVPAKPSLTITKTGNGPWTVGQSGATYTLSVRNEGPGATSGAVTVRDLLPSGITAPASFTSGNWSCTTSGQTVTCTGTPNLGAGSSSDLTFGVTVGSAASATPTITNRASVGGGGDPDPIPDPANCATTGGQCAVYSTSVTVPVTPPTCSRIYALTIASGSGASDVNGVTIRELDEQTNTVGATIATLPDSTNSATLAVSTNARRFFVADQNNRLRIFDTVLGTWSSGGIFSGVTDRLVRMTVTSTGVGYAMDSGRNLWRFETASPYTVTSLGQLSATTAGAPSFNINGDFFADSSGKLYMISSATGSATIDLWLVVPDTLRAEYLGRLSNPSTGSQFNGIAASPSGIYARDNQGRLVKINLADVSYTPVGSNTLGSTDLASCTFPVIAPSLSAVKSVKKVAGTTGDKVQPGDTLEYQVIVRNSGTLPAGGVTFQDALPAGTAYVPDSARVNGFTTTVTGQNTTSLGGAAYPFAQPVGICSADGAACTTQVLKIDSTTTLDNEAVVTFRVTVVSPFTLDPAQVRNVARVDFTGGPSTGVPSNEVVTPVYQPAKLTVAKTVRNVTRNGAVGTTGEGNPGDVLEYCITTTNVGGLNATNISFSDVVPNTTTFTVAGFGAGKDIRLTAASGEVFYTADADADAGQLKDGKVLVQGGSFILAPTQSVTICFRATIR
ncbi:DUF11 domain-containing protein [Deinococcus sp. 12RED42]|uniref:DUF11 domain-containing protein n=1 Tax=Deinococcus sp. 12RED42 TaxID=2745872 RepID=UPI001E5CB4D5|nr:DUF11 domain-containing protein [Deinococcus sp. 12RED42]MCD0164223.1 DUF11 domain-containing protein [Deinococcus sp. 12RED42]